MNAKTEAVDAIAAHWADGMWPIIWQSALLAGIILVVTLAVRRLSPAVRFWLWMLVPMRLLVMPLVTVSLPLLPAPVPELAPAGVVPTVDSVRTARAPGPRPAAAEVAEAPRSTGSMGGAVAAPTAAMRPTVWMWFMAGWLVGSAACVARVLRGCLQVRRLAARAEEAAGPTIPALAREAAERLSLTRVPPIRVTSENVSPFLCGVFRPVVVLPESLVDPTSSTELSAVLAHEFAHLRRRDLLLGWLLTICEAFYYFHPIFHLAKRRILFERERACDAAVLANSPEPPSAYARALIASADICSATGARFASASAVAESFGNLKQRVTRICRDAKPTGSLSKASVAALAGLTLLSLPAIVLTARSDAPATAAATPAAGQRGERPDTVTFRGIVTDAAGAPVSGVMVRSDVAHYPRETGYEMGEAETRTGQDGRFELGPLPRLDKQLAPRQILFAHPEYAIAWYGPSWDWEVDPDDARIELAARTVVSGKIRDRAGNPIAGATVEADVQIGSSAGYRYFHASVWDGMAVTTDAEGRFLLQHIPEGARLHLTVRHPQYATHATEHEHRNAVFPILSGSAGLQIILDRGAAIMGRLLLDEKPYRRKGVLVRAEAVSLARKRARGVTDKDGRFLITGLSAGSYSLRVDHQTLPDASVVGTPRPNVAVAPEAEPTSVDLTVSRGEVLAGRVLNERTGQPVAGQLLSAYLPVKRPVIVNGARCDAQGRYELRLPPGEFLVRTRGWSKGMPRQHEERIRVAPGQAPDRLDLVVGVRPQIPGRLVDQQGKSIAGTIGRIRTASDGTFSKPAPADDWPYVHFEFAFDRQRKLGRLVSWDPQTIAKARAGGGDFVIQLGPLASIVGRLFNDKGQPTADVVPRLRIQTPSGGSTGLGHSPWTTRVEPDGAFTIRNVPTGAPMSLAVEKPGFQTIYKVKALEPGEVFDIGPVTLQAVTGLAQGKTEWTATLSGRVLDQDARPVRDAHVFVGLPSRLTEDETDADGRFMLTKLPAGRKVDVHVQWPGYHARFPDTSTGRKDLDLRVVPPGYELYGKPAPPLMVQKWLNSEPLSLAALRGKVVLLEIGTHIKWQPRPFHRMSHVAAKYEDRGLVVIGIHKARWEGWPKYATEEEIAAHLKERQIAFPVAHDQAPKNAFDKVPEERRQRASGATYLIYDARTAPQMYLIDKKGLLRSAPTRDHLDEWIERLLGE